MDRLGQLGTEKVSSSMAAVDKVMIMKEGDTSI